MPVFTYLLKGGMYQMCICVRPSGRQTAAAALGKYLGAPPLFQTLDQAPHLSSHLVITRIVGDLHLQLRKWEEHKDIKTAQCTVKK